jgi:hypothetical protein
LGFAPAPSGKSKASAAVMRNVVFMVLFLLVE